MSLISFLEICSILYFNFFINIYFMKYLTKKIALKILGIDKIDHSIVISDPNTRIVLWFT